MTTKQIWKQVGKLAFYRLLQLILLLTLVGCGITITIIILGYGKH